VRVLDFGASSTSTRQLETSDPLQRNPVPAVTPAYTCCELLDGQQSDPRDDLYALACLSYELLAGKHPFQRLPSTEARDLGMRPPRPQGVTHRQWRSLRLGLSWYRESRSLAVRDWLAKLGLRPTAELLPPPHALDAMLPRRLNPRAVPRVALLASLIAGLGLWVALRHASFAVNVGGTVAPQATLNAPTGSQPTPVHQMTVLDAGILPQLTPAGLPGQPFLTELRTASVARDPDPSSESVAREPTVGAARTIGADKITISAGTYSVRSGEHFAEINVRRSDEARGNGSFVWWTEASSAKPGNDFVSQGRTTQAFSKGRRLARLFIRIVPNPSRTHAETFYVVIGQPSGGYFLGPITRAAILIPPLG
jgi:serine/threonine protein kinase